MSFFLKILYENYLNFTQTENKMLNNQKHFIECFITAFLNRFFSFSSIFFNFLMTLPFYAASD